MGEVGGNSNNQQKDKLQNTYFAHSGEKSDFSDWQTLQSHLHGVGELAAQFASWFGGQDLAKHAGLLHDLGKYCPEFMARLQGSSKRVEHATAGAKVAIEKWGDYRQATECTMTANHEAVKYSNACF